MLNDPSSTVRTDTVGVRGRCRVAADTIVVEADLSEHPVVDTVLEDHDIDQVVEWARVTGCSALVFRRAQFVHVTPLEGMFLLAELPRGAEHVVEDLRRFTVEEGYEFCEVARRVPLRSLFARRDVGPPRSMPPVRMVSDDELLTRTARGNAATHAAVQELLVCRADWPEFVHSGALMGVWQAIIGDRSLGHDQLALATDLYEMAKAATGRLTPPTGADACA